MTLSGYAKTAKLRIPVCVPLMTDVLCPGDRSHVPILLDTYGIPLR